MVSTSIARAVTKLFKRIRRTSGGAAGVQCSAMSSPRCPEVGAGVGRCRFFALRCIGSSVWGRYLSALLLEYDKMLRMQLSHLVPSSSKSGAKCLLFPFLAPQSKKHIPPTARRIFSSRFFQKPSFPKSVRNCTSPHGFVSAWNMSDVAQRAAEKSSPQNMLLGLLRV